MQLPPPAPPSNVCLPLSLTVQAAVGVLLPTWALLLCESAVRDRFMRDTAPAPGDATDGGMQLPLASRRRAAACVGREADAGPTIVTRFVQASPPPPRGARGLARSARPGTKKVALPWH